MILESCVAIFGAGLIVQRVATAGPAHQKAVSE